VGLDVFTQHCNHLCERGRLAMSGGGRCRLYKHDRHGFMKDLINKLLALLPAYASQFIELVSACAWGTPKCVSIS
jgi:hypothetical protein